MVLFQMARSKEPEAPANILFAHSYCLICRSHPLNESNWSVCVYHTVLFLFLFNEVELIPLTLHLARLPELQLPLQ